MSLNNKFAFSLRTCGYGYSLPPDGQRQEWSIDSEFYEQQCALLERNEQAARRRTHENEYWRQRTLARRMQTLSGTISYPGLSAPIDDDMSLEATDAKHRTGEILNVFMDEYNKLTPPSLFLDWVSSMSPTAQTILIESAMLDAGYTGVVSPAWVRAFNRSLRHMNAGERSSYRIDIRDSLLYQNGVLFDTRDMKTQRSGTGVAIFIQSVDGTFYSSSHVGGRLFSSSPYSDDLCKSTGEWKVVRGRIEWVSGKAGLDRLPTAARSQPTIKL